MWLPPIQFNSGRPAQTTSHASDGHLPKHSTTSCSVTWQMISACWAMDSNCEPSHCKQWSRTQFRRSGSGMICIRRVLNRGGSGGSEKCRSGLPRWVGQTVRTVWATLLRQQSRAARRKGAPCPLSYGVPHHALRRRMSVFDPLRTLELPGIGASNSLDC